MIDLVAFDMAGTTVRDDGLVLEAYRFALERHHIAYTEEALAARRGAAKLTVFRELVALQFAGEVGQKAERVAEAAFADFERRLDEAYRTGPLEPIPGAAETFAWLHAHGMKVALTTGFDSRLQRLILDRLGWGPDVVDACCASDQVPRGRPAPYMIFAAMQDAAVSDVRRVVVVGDTPLDLRAGVNAGAAGVVGVLTGAHGLETLGATRHTHLIPSVAELPELLRSEFRIRGDRPRAPSSRHPSPAGTVA